MLVEWELTWIRIVLIINRNFRVSILMNFHLKNYNLHGLEYIPRWFFPAWLTVTLLNNFYWNKKEFHRCSLPWFPWIKDIMWLHETRQIVMCFCDVYKAIIIHIDKKLLIFVTLLSSCGDCSASYCAFIFCCSCSGHLIIPQLPST